MSKMRRCDAGLHMYDASKHSMCPQCGNELFNLEGVNNVNESQKPTRKIGGEPAPDIPTVNGAQQPAQATPQADGRTQVLRTKKGIRPVTAWFVVTKGPGKGASLSIYHGVNYIGRSRHIGEGERRREQEISLSFGSGPDEQDKEISREDQARVTYDKKGNVFYLQQGSSNTLTYLNDQPVLELKKLSAYDQITMGSTMLTFVPLCGEQFQWPED